MLECKEIIYPLLNETFGESYDSRNTIEFLNEEHEDSSDEIFKETLISDANFIVMDAAGKLCGRYIYECQSSADNTMTVRMFRYGVRAAFENRYLENGILHISLPDAAVIYLRGNGKYSLESSVVKIDFHDKSLDYEMKILRYKQYSIDELFEKQLYVLVPFMLFLYESELPNMNSDDEKLAELLKVYEKIIRILSEEEFKGNITSFQKIEILNVLNSVTAALANKYDNIVKGVENTMGGQILKFPVTEALKESRREGCQEGRQEGQIYGRIDLLHEEHKSDEAIILNIMNKFNLSNEQAKKYFSDWEKMSSIQEA